MLPIYWSKRGIFIWKATACVWYAAIIFKQIEIDSNFLVGLLLFFSKFLYGYFGRPLVCRCNFLLFLVLKLAMISARGFRHGILWSRKLSQRSNMTQRLFSRQDPSRDIANCLFLLISDLVVFYRHAESCQLVIFVNSYFYRRIL